MNLGICGCLLEIVTEIRMFLPLTEHHENVKLWVKHRPLTFANAEFLLKQSLKKIALFFLSRMKKIIMPIM